MRLIAVFGLATLLVSPAAGQTGSAKSVTTLNTEVNSLWPDNTSGQITPFNARQTLLDVIASSLNIVSNPNLNGVYVTTKYGMMCDGTTDDTSAFSALLTTVNTAGGGTILWDGNCKIAGQITLPNDGQVTPRQSAIRITGLMGNYYGMFLVPPATSPSVMNLTFNASDAKIQTFGAGVLEIDHLKITDSGSDCATFIHTTHTTLIIHDNAVSGTTQTASCNDFLVFGGSGAIDNTTNSAFQGYGTTIAHNFFDNIRHGAVYNGAANGINFVENTVSLTSGDPATKSITAATNANPAILTSSGHGFAVGDLVRLKISGATGNWTPINGSAVVATIIDANTFSVPVNSTTFGALTGSPVYPDGTFLEFSGSAMYSTAGNYTVGNLVEMTNYAYFARLSNSTQNQFITNNLFDGVPGTTVSFYKSVSAAANGGMIMNGYQDCGTPVLVGLSVGITVNNQASGCSSLNGVFSQWTSDAHYTGINTFQGGGTKGIRSDSTTQFTWSGPFNTDKGTQSTSAVTGDIVTAGGIGVGKDMTLAGNIFPKGAQSIFGTQGAANMIALAQTSSNVGASMQADGTNLVFRNATGTGGGLFFDSFGTGVTTFRSNGGSTTQMTLSLAGDATVLGRVGGANLQSKTIYSAAGTPVPTCNGAAEGTRVSVSDTTGPTYHSVYTSGGAVHGPLYCDGTNWLND